MIPTSHGILAVEESGESGIPVLLIHGNSFCRGVFRNQMQGKIAKNHRVIAFDLPGQGQSSDAPGPHRSYTRPGLADATVELLHKLGVAEAIVFGWSLGGHIGIELIPRFPGMRGLMICGAPPVGRNQMSQAFKGSPQTGAASKQDISEAENRNSRRKHFWGFIRTVSSRSRRAGRRAFSQEAFRGGACRGRGGSAADRGKQSSPARSGQRWR